MLEDNMIVLWADGYEWIIKREHHQYFHRKEGDYGPWHPGTPPGTRQTDVDLAFET